VEIDVAQKRKKASAKKTTKKTVKSTAKRTVKSTAKKAVKSSTTKAVKSAGKKAVKKNTTKKSSSTRRLRASELKYFKEMLLEKRREIFQNVFEIEGEALKKSRLDASGDLSSMPIHMADLGTDNYEQEFALGLMDSERRLITEIDEALQRIEAGTYGICLGTGKPIPKARLEAQPWARYCVEYARMVEQGLVEEGQ
jgi:RNA polymerase-binding protein DksA